MKTIFKIAKNELKILFFSPIPWLLLVVFSVQVGIAYSDTIVGLLKSQALGFNLKSLTYTLFSSDFGGILLKAQNYILLYIPLLTMGIISKEFSSGSIKLLFSSPIKSSQIVIGKYLSLAFYNIILMLPLFLIGIFTYFTVESADMPLILTGILGIYLLTCTYSAVGLFMSSLTSYQIVAAICSMAMLSLLSYIGNVGQSITLVRDITYWLSISGRSNEMISGLIASEDVIYFFVVSMLFLAFTILRLRFKKEQSSAFFRTISYVSLIVFAFAIGYASRQPNMRVYHDSTHMKSNTLTSESQEIMASLKNSGRMTITTYANIFANEYTSVLPQYINKDIDDRFKIYTRFKPDIRFDYVYYYHKSQGVTTTNPRFSKMTEAERAESLAKIYKLNFDSFMTPEEAELIDGLPEEDFRFTRIIETKDGKKARLRNYEDQIRVPTESEISAAMKTLIIGSVKINVLTGKNERSIHGIKDEDYNMFTLNNTFRYALISNGFEVDTLSLQSDKKLSDNTDILLISDPKQVYNEEELAEIKEYVANGGNLVIASSSRNRENIRPLVNHLGVDFIDGVIVQKSENLDYNLTLANPSTESSSISKNFNKMLSKGEKISLPDAMGLTHTLDSGYSIFPILQTDVIEGDSILCWNEIETTNFDDMTPVFNSDVGEKPLSAVPVALGLERKLNGKSQRILIVGNADCFSNKELTSMRMGIETSNISFILGAFYWLSNGEYPIDTYRKPDLDNKIKNISIHDKYWVKRIFVWIIPIVIILLGAVILIRRKGR